MIQFPSGNGIYIFFSSVFFIGGGALLFSAYKDYQKTETLVQFGKKTVARVIRLEVNNGSEGNVYSPVFEFVDDKNETQEYQNEWASSVPEWGMGEQVDIIYNPDNVHQVKVISYWGFYRSFILSLIPGIALLIVSTSYFIYLFRFKT